MINHTLTLKLLVIVFMLFGYTINGQSSEDSEELMGFKEEILTKTNADNRYASYNKEGSKIIFESNRDGHWQIYVMDINGNSQRRLITSDSNDRRPRWNPFKDMILFESDRTGTSEIYSYDFETNRVEQYPINLNGNKYFADFAPNGVQLIFSHAKNSEYFDIYTCSTKGKRLKKVISNEYKNLYPNLTPRGDNIIYYSNKNVQGESNIIYTYNPYTKEKNRLTYFKDESLTPSWSNVRGSRIAYSAKVDDMVHSEIFIMRNDGTHKIQITYNDTEDILPIWSPNDINLLITGFRNGHYQICKILLKEPLNPEQKPLD
ncbi:PD40 domain-containing protein [Gaetbulibacter saemankumensis]|uniref:PD40 domain-containing protein n=1 Tax=Gaetbulibacter saemankumensis TaxID=311208 RepID=UPI0012FC188F|nr:PD40 domain-containing protein [Gaetbulibacter saemankumensis]